MDRPPSSRDGCKPDLFPISELAARVGASQTKIRNFERLGLLKPIPIGRFRFYTGTDIETYKRVSELRRLGLPLKIILQIFEHLPADGAWAEAPVVVEAIKVQQEKLARRQKILRS